MTILLAVVWRNRNLLGFPLLMGMKIGTITENIYHYLEKISITNNTTIPLLGVYVFGRKSYMHTQKDNNLILKIGWGWGRLRKQMRYWTDKWSRQ